VREREREREEEEEEEEEDEEEEVLLLLLAGPKVWEEKEEFSSSSSLLLNVRFKRGKKLLTREETERVKGEWFFKKYREERGEFLVWLIFSFLFFWSNYCKPRERERERERERASSKFLLIIYSKTIMNCCPEKETERREVWENQRERERAFPKGEKTEE